MVQRLGGRADPGPRRPAPGWYVATSYLGEGLRKGCLTLLPVVAARRARYGGAIRPAEFAALCVGASRLLLSFERLPALGLVVPAPGRPGYYRVNIEAYRAWNLIQLAIAALAAWVVATRRRRLPAATVGASVLVVWWGLSVPSQFFYQQGRNAILEAMPLPWTATRALDTLLTLPFGIVYLVPMAAAVLDFRRPFRPGRTWVEWAGLALAAASWLASEFRYLAMIYLDLPRSRFFADTSLHAAALLVERGGRRARATLREPPDRACAARHLRITGWRVARALERCPQRGAGGAGRPPSPGGPGTRRRSLRSNRSPGAR